MYVCSAYVKEIIGEQRSHFSHNALDEHFRCVFRDIQSDVIKHRPPQVVVIMLHKPVVAVRNHLRICLSDGRGVSWRVKLRKNADTPIASVIDQVVDDIAGIRCHRVIRRLLLQL